MRDRFVLRLAAGSAGITLAARADPCDGVSAQRDGNPCIASAAEHAWIGFRDRECASRPGYDTGNPGDDGTLAPSRPGECPLDLTHRRTADLHAQVACPGGRAFCSP